MATGVSAIATHNYSKLFSLIGGEVHLRVGGVLQRLHGIARPGTSVVTSDGVSARWSPPMYGAGQFRGRCCGSRDVGYPRI